MREVALERNMTAPAEMTRGVSPDSRVQPRCLRSGLCDSPDQAVAVVVPHLHDLAHERGGSASDAIERADDVIAFAANVQHRLHVGSRGLVPLVQGAAHEAGEQGLRRDAVTHASVRASGSTEGFDVDPR